MRELDLAYLLKRLSLVIPTMFGVLVIVFILTRVIGNPVAVALGDRISQSDLEARLEKLGYNRPIYEQFIEFLMKVLQGDLGTSVRTGESVSGIIGSYLPATIELGILAMAVAFPISIALSRFAYKREGKISDHVLRFLALVAYAVPVFLIAILLRLALSNSSTGIPSNGRASILTVVTLAQGQNSGFYFLDSLAVARLDFFGDVALHAFLPVLTLSLAISATLFRATRAAYVDNSRTPSAHHARTMGLGEKTVNKFFVYRPSRPEVLSVFGLVVAGVLTGVIFTETAFEWRGLGYAVSYYISLRDFEVVQGLAITLSFIVVVVHSFSDWLSRVFNPKIRKYQG